MDAVADGGEAGEAARDPAGIAAPGGGERRLEWRDGAAVDGEQAPDGSHVLFSTLFEAETRTYAITVDGKSRPRLVLETGEALDWLP